LSVTNPTSHRIRVPRPFFWRLGICSGLIFPDVEDGCLSQAAVKYVTAGQ
jgi:hypothetical protein